MTPFTPEALALSGELAASLGQGIRPEGAAYAVPSRTEAGVYYQVLLGPEGDATCTCRGYEIRRDCWHCQHVREERNMTTQALTTIKVAPPPSVLPTKDELEAMDMVAARLYASGAVALPENLKTQRDVATVILAGWELGVKPGTALRHIAVIKGKAEPDGQLMAGIVTSREPDASFEITKDDGAVVTVRFRRPSKKYDVLYTYSMEDAKKAGLLTGVNWQKFPRDMMRWAAIKRLCRTYASDLINGIQSAVYGDMPATLAPVPDLDEEEPFIEGSARLVDDDLYSEGDGPDAPTEAVETPTAAPPTPKALRGQEAQAYTELTQRVSALCAKVKDAYPADWKATMATIKESYPETDGGERGFYPNRVSHEHGPELLRFLLHKQAGVDNHEPQYSEDAARLQCGICGVAMAEPEGTASDATTEEQPALID